MPTAEPQTDTKPLVSNALTAEERQHRLAQMEQQSETEGDDPAYRAYLDRVFAAAAEYRREVDEQERRWLDDAEGK